MWSLAKEIGFQFIGEENSSQGLSQDLETGCPKLADGKLLGILFFKVDHNISDRNKKHVPTELK